MVMLEKVHFVLILIGKHMFQSIDFENNYKKYIYKIHYFIRFHNK